MISHDVAAPPRMAEVRPLGWFDEARTEKLDRLGIGVLRYGIVGLLLLFGAMKFTVAEAEGIKPLLEHSPLFGWLVTAFGTRGASDVIGVVELTTAILMLARRWSPRASAVGSLLASVTFAITLSFLVTTPGILAPENPMGGFLMKDILFLGGALATAAEALRAVRSSR